MIVPSSNPQGFGVGRERNAITAGYGSDGGYATQHGDASSGPIDQGGGSSGHVVNEFHYNDDVDVSQWSHHHTLGFGPGQAAPGFELIANIYPRGCGAIWFGPESSVPDGWILMHGQAISRVDNPVLFEAWGTLHGAGNGSTTFNVPNTKVRILIGEGTDGIDPTNIGEHDGLATETLRYSGIISTAHFHDVVGTSGSAGAHTHNDHGFASNTPQTGGAVRLNTPTHSTEPAHSHGAGTYIAETEGLNQLPFIFVGFIVRLG